MIRLIKLPQMFNLGEILFAKMIKAMGIQAFVPGKPKNLKLSLTSIQVYSRHTVLHSVLPRSFNAML